MASTKISALASGAPVVKSDLHVLARGATNKKLTTAELFQETLTLTDFETKRAASGLIAGRTYRVTGCGLDEAQTLQVDATAPNQYSRHVLWESTFGPVWADWLGLSEWPKLVEDWQGNRYANYLDGGILPPLNQGNWENNWLDGKDANIEFYDFESCFVISSKFLSGVYYVSNTSITHSQFINSAIFNSNAVSLGMNRVSMSSSTINNSSEQAIHINDLTLVNTTLNFDSDRDITINKSHFENVTVNIVNGAIVDGLTILGKVTDGEDAPIYTIDGNYQSQVLNNWAGVVVADRYRGTSTVRAKINTISSGTGFGTYSIASKNLTLLDGSPVGVYYLNHNVATTYEVITVYTASNNKWNAVEFRKLERSASNWTFITETSGNNIDTTGMILRGHGTSTKLGQLVNVNTGDRDFVVVRFSYQENIDDLIWCVVDGAHYD